MPPSSSPVCCSPLGPFIFYVITSNESLKRKNVKFMYHLEVNVPFISAYYAKEMFSRMTNSNQFHGSAYFASRANRHQSDVNRHIGWDGSPFRVPRGKKSLPGDLGSGGTPTQSVPGRDEPVAVVSEGRPSNAPRRSGFIDTVPERVSTAPRPEPSPAPARAAAGSLPRE